MTREIPLGKGRTALIDDIDVDLVSQYTWSIQTAGYAQAPIRRSNGKRIFATMHRLILDAPAGVQVDHINGIRLDNRRSNLRLCNAFQNLRNQRHHAGAKAPYKGIYQNHGTGRWVGQIWVNERYLHLGTHATPEEAARAYDAAARLHFGEFARCNFEEPKP